MHSEIPRNQATTLDLIRRVLLPYDIDAVRVDWYTTYHVNQRVATSASHMDRIFLCGDAIHSQSAKSGMGMNTGIQDAYNLGWKIANVLNGSDSRLLLSYEEERLPVARRLVAFDMEFCDHFIHSFPQQEVINTSIDEEHNTIAGIFCNYATLAPLTWGGDRSEGQSLVDLTIIPEKGVLKLGSRFPPVQLLHHFGGSPVHFDKVLKNAGHWYMLLFAGNIGTNRNHEQALRSLAESSAFDSADEPASLLKVVTIYSSSRMSTTLAEVPKGLCSRKGDGVFRYDCLFVDDEGYDESCDGGCGRAYQRLFGEDKGNEIQRLVLLRPDTHVAFVGAFAELQTALRMATGRFQNDQLGLAKM